MWQWQLHKLVQLELRFQEDISLAFVAPKNPSGDR